MRRPWIYLFSGLLLLLSLPGPMAAQVQARSSQLNLTAVSFATARDGWAAGTERSQGILFRTDDGGRSWSAHALPFEATRMQFINAVRGWATVAYPVHCDVTRGPCRSAIEWTADGGRTWTPGAGVDRCSELSSLQMANGLDGWAVETENPCTSHRARARVIRTADGGRSWHVVFNAQTQIGDLHFADARHGWLAGNDLPHCTTVLDHTADGGSTWQRGLRLRGYCEARVDFVDANHGWLLANSIAGCSMGGCYDYRLYRTVDGGRQWSLEQGQHPRRSPVWSGPSGFLGPLHFVTRRVGYIPVGMGAGPGQGGIDVTRDGGAHWTRLQPHGLEVGDVSPVDAGAAWATGCTPPAAPCHVLMHTGNAGRSWAIVSPVERS